MRFVVGFCLLVSTGSALGFWFFSQEDKTPQTLEQSSKIKPSNRLLELGDTKGRVNKTQKEDEVALNDPALSQAWGIQKSDAKRAWSVSQGSKDIVVAVIDTGADVFHEDLEKNIWVNPGESGLDAKGRNKASNKIDDDGNGFVDDVNGWNFVANSNDLSDNHGHGTHIAGIVGAQAGNGKGIVGIAPKVSLMVLKYFDPKVPTNDALKNTVEAIRYAVKMKANVINYSGGGLEPSDQEREAIAEAGRNGILFVAAAGNERSNSDIKKYYPADYGLPNIISVTAHDPGIQVLASSNFGTETVDIAAPGQNILSTLPGNSYGNLTGTSQATAFVTGAAVLVMARHLNFEPADVKKYILQTGDSDSGLIAKTRTSRRLNLYKAITMLENGQAVNGVVATNTANIESFNPESRKKLNSNVGKINEFSRGLMKELERTAAQPIEK